MITFAAQFFYCGNINHYLVKADDFLSLYSEDSMVKMLANEIMLPSPSVIHLKGLRGCLDTLLAASMQKLTKKSHLFVLQDKEEAFFFLHNLESLLGKGRLLFFPVSYRKPYEYEEVDNANVLQRAETLTELAKERSMIVTYPEALGEKVITRKSLSSHTFRVKKGETADRAFLEEFLHSYHFEKTDFVYEPGQFSVRGGLVDVFSFAHEFPYRIEFFGDEVDAIRRFDPGSQLSVGAADEVTLLPNVNTHFEKEERQSFLEYLSPSTCLWLKDAEAARQAVGKTFAKAAEEYSNKKQIAGNNPLLTDPSRLFDAEAHFSELLNQFTRVEFGTRRTFKPSREMEFSASAQPAFKKNFELLAGHMLEQQQKGYRNIIAADQPKQAERLHEIFREINPELRFETLPISLSQGCIDHMLKITCYTDHQIFERFHSYRSKERFSKSKALTLRELQMLQPGDFVTHIDYGIAKFAGLEKKEVNGNQQEAIRLVFRDNDLLYINIHALHKISKYSGRDGAVPAISKLGSGEWENKKEKVRKKVKDIAKELIELYAKRKTAPGFAFGKDNFLQAELESSFLYEDTPDQAKAAEDVKRDMMKPHPMDRLVCGDVGFGKTEVAVRAAFKAVSEGKQAAVLVPTTILAFQHYRTFSQRLRAFPVKINYVSRFKKPQEIQKILNELKTGELNIVIGTHRVASKDVVFKDLGLLIVDEEQKFGVKVKDRLKEMKVNVDVLTLTATPIPRTLHFSLMGARDLSIIATPPPNRQPVTTELHAFSETLIRDAVSRELKRGGQVFIVHNRVHDIEQIANLVFRLVPESRIGIAHGQMEGDRLEKAMLKFIDGEYDILVSTNIIESGLDIPNANTILINHAHLFGLSDLHQMRGRVGRSNTKAYCYLLTPPALTLSSDSRKRLQALEEFSDLGDGFKVAMRDLDIRGAGNLLGAEQSGFITDLGFDAYHRILDDAVQELKETDFKELFQEELANQAKLLTPDCNIETDLEILIPETYISSVSERLQLYSSLDNLKDEEALREFQRSIRDRFGVLPEPVLRLLDAVRLRWIGERLGMEKIILKGGKLRAQFMEGNKAFYQSEIFGNLLNFVKSQGRRVALKEGNKNLTLSMDDVPSVEHTMALLEPLLGKKQEG